MDHYAIEAERHHQAQEDAAEAACASAADHAGVSAALAAECDDGACSCEACPWRLTSTNWRPAA